MTKTTDPRFDHAMECFLALLLAREITHVRANFSSLEPGSFEVSPGGKRYVRVVKRASTCSKEHVGQASAYCFVERATGNIYKPAGWKTPTLNMVRGNIYESDALKGTGVYGTAYAWELR